MSDDRYSINDSELENINKICVICWGLIGDVFIRVPTIEALRTRFPDSYILVVVDPAGERAVKNHPDINNIFVFDRNKKSLSRYLIGTVKNILYLRHCKFDLSIDLYSGGSSARIVNFMKAKIRLSFDHTEKLRKSNNLLVRYPDFSKQWNKAIGSILQPLGIPLSSIRAGTSFYCSEAAEEFAKDFLGNTQKRFFALNLGAGTDTKRWPISKFVELARLVSEKYGLYPLVLSNPGMTELTDQFVDQYQHIGNLVKAPLVYIDKDAALMKRCQYVITGDTSIMHLAFALKIPTLILFTNTRPEPVLPEDCLYRYCFIPSKSEKDNFGQALGSFDIPVKMALEKFDELVLANQNKSSQIN